MLSVPHMIVVFIIVLVVFGPNKLPELARGLGKLMAEFRKASADFKGAFEQEMRDLERQTMLAERKKAAEAAAASAAAAPEQPATLATVAGTDTQPDQSGDTRATEALVATPVAEAVARGSSEGTPSAGGGSEAAGTGNDDTLSANDDTVSGKGDIVSGNDETVSDHEDTSGNQHNGPAASPREAPTSAVAHDPAHDTQQPA